MPQNSVNLENYLSDIRSAELVRFTLGFGVLFFVLLLLYQVLQDTAAYRYYLDEMMVKPSVGLIGLIGENENVRAAGYRLVWADGRLSVLSGCDGVDAMMLLAAALLASALPWRARLLGILLGVALIYALNLGRIVALYFAFRYHDGLFELIHGVLGPLAIIGAVLLFLLAFRNRHAHALAA